MNKNLTYEELHDLVNSAITKKGYGHLKTFCTEHELKYEYVLNVLSNKHIKYPKMLVNLANALGYEVETQKTIQYNFVIETQHKTSKRKNTT